MKNLHRERLVPQVWTGWIFFNLKKSLLSSFGFVQTQNNVVLEVFLTSRFNPFWPKLFNGSARNYAILEPLRSQKFVWSRRLRGTSFQGSSTTIIFSKCTWIWSLELTFIEISRISTCVLRIGYPEIDFYTFLKSKFLKSHS